MPSAHPYVWTDLPSDAPMAGIDRRRLIGQHVMLSRVTLQQGTVVAPHRHANEQVALIESGRMRFVLGDASDRVVDLGAGEILHLPPNELHGAEALETSVVVDIFSPPSEKTGIDTD